MLNVKEIYHNIPDQFKNKYVLAFLAFLAWMLFFDENDMISQIKLRLHLNELRNQKEFYLEKTKEVRADKEELLSNKKSMEKFAREKYWMKKDDEDIYIIIPKEN